MGGFLEDVTDLDSAMPLVVKANGTTKTLTTDYTVEGPGLLSLVTPTWGSISSGFRHLQLRPLLILSQRHSVSISAFASKKTSSVLNGFGLSVGRSAVEIAAAPASCV
jgi:hypothetical protein